MIRSIADFCPEGAEAGVGLAMQDDEGRYLFFVAGLRHTCPEGERFYAGIGGHREPGEDWLACAHREALEEVSADVEILSALTTWTIPQHGPVQQVDLTDRECALLATLMGAPGRVFSRPQLLMHAFEGVDSDGAVDLYVHYLRRKLGKRVIRTVHGTGYRFGLE